MFSTDSEAMSDRSQCTRINHVLSAQPSLGDRYINLQLTVCVMEYHEAAEYLESLQHRRPKLGVETTVRMLSHLEKPQEDIDCVQVAGSNGKGSTARMLENVLRNAGLDVGL